MISDGEIRSVKRDEVLFFLFVNCVLIEVGESGEHEAVHLFVFYQ